MVGRQAFPFGIVYFQRQAVELPGCSFFQHHGTRSSEQTRYNCWPSKDVGGPTNPPVRCRLRSVIVEYQSVSLETIVRWTNLMPWLDISQLWYLLFVRQGEKTKLRFQPTYSTPGRYPGRFTNSLWRKLSFFVGFFGGSLGYLPRGPCGKNHKTKKLQPVLLQWCGWRPSKRFLSFFFWSFRWFEDSFWNPSKTMDTWHLGMVFFS